MSRLPSWEEFNCTGLAALYVGFSNFAARKPVFARLPRYAVACTIGYFIGKYMTHFLQQRVIQRDVVLWDYVKNHPDDFPEYAPRKFKDVFDVWHPMR